MRRKIQKFEKCSSGAYQSILKNQHGRKIYLKLETDSRQWRISECWYFDRNIGKTGEKRKSAQPLLWKTKVLDSDIEKLTRMLINELDMTPFLKIEFVENEETFFMTAEKFIEHYTADDKYHFLILIKSENEKGVVLETVIKNKIHRRIYIKLSLQKDKAAYILEEAYYSDKIYRQNERKMPETVVDGYTKGLRREDIIKWFNEQLTNDFNALLFVSPEDITIDKRKAICGTL